MKNNRLKVQKIFILCLFLAICISGCAVPKMRRSPYLQNVDLNIFRKHEYAKNFVMFTNPTSDWQKYNKFILSPVLVSINPALEYQHLNPTALKLTSDILIEEVQNGLRIELTETTTSSKNVINIKLALTNLMAPSRDKEIGSMQIGLIPIGLNGAIFEAYFEDALTGELLAIVRDERIGLSNTTKFFKGFSSSKFLHHSFALWGTELCNILLEKSGRSRKDKNESDQDNLENISETEQLQSKETLSSEIENPQQAEFSPMTKQSDLGTEPLSIPEPEKTVEPVIGLSTQNTEKIESQKDDSLGDDSFKF